MPAPGHEVYGFVPYWEMDGTIADHVAATDAETLALFSVTNRATAPSHEPRTATSGSPARSAAQMIREAHDRHVRVELVFSSFGSAAQRAAVRRTRRGQDKVIASLVAFAHDLGVDGINVDVESLGPRRSSRRTAGSSAGSARRSAAITGQGQVSVATTAGTSTGAAMAAAAAAAGADRIFLMGYDYHGRARTPGRRRRSTGATARRRTSPGRSTCTPRPACPSSGRSSACRSTAWRGP